MTKMFDKSIHQTCPNCGSEVIEVSPADKTIALVLLNGQPDEESREVDLDAKNEDTYRHQCNSRYCAYVLKQGE
ncbi:hypothetical protein [Paenibacillus graminis]|uniref:hypothetical protein n=1 Tax=Paenibacillus graminis TaxID=189425 RepID=UPI002DB858C1|nr:hypothetical protein [Paenibacillus graminis]MEC0167412.1 hypothetical protein [Paenibacillus graminis]